MKKQIDQDFLAREADAFAARARNRIAMNAVVANGVFQSAAAIDAPREDRCTFSVELKQGSITDQKQSGRCWMFAALNTMRCRVMQRLNLSDVELSQAYPLFYDKLEKANYFLENILQTLDEPTEGRLLAFLLATPIQDGGQWDMFAGIVEKYGVVPKEAMPESVSSSNTKEMTTCITEKLREDAFLLRTAWREGTSMEDLRAKKEGMMSEIYRMLCICLGTPPTTFPFEVRDKDDVFIREEALTPQAFFRKYVEMDLDNYISIINAPTSDKPYGRTYTVKFLGSVVEGRPVKYLNLSIDELKAAAIAQLKGGEPVWFGSDVGAHSLRAKGLMDLDAMDLTDLFDVTFGMDKAARLDYGQSQMTHAMVLQGVNLDGAGRPDRWKVENSWGEKSGKKGYFIMTDGWFSEFTYQVVINKKYLSKTQLTLWEQEPIELEPWDPMGSLALTK